MGGGSVGVGLVSASLDYGSVMGVFSRSLNMKSKKGTKDKKDADGIETSGPRT